MCCLALSALKLHLGLAEACVVLLSLYIFHHVTGQAVAKQRSNYDIATKFGAAGNAGGSGQVRCFGPLLCHSAV